MDFKERLRKINANSFYGAYPVDRDHMIKEIEDILKKKFEKENPMAFIDEFIFEQKEE